MNSPISALLDSKESEIHTVSPTTTVAEAVQEMIREKIGSVLVVEGDALVGIFTERDVLVRVVGANRDPRTTPIAHVMTRDPISIPSTTTVEDVMDMHSGKNFRHLPVVDHGRLVGMVSFRDILRWIAEASGETS
ncbi:MAG: CBS domain-containing protein [Opitutaceae bacterium]|nr:CBS domain-containing protein [Opitutaceae bacterium]